MIDLRVGLVTYEFFQILGDGVVAYNSFKTSGVTADARAAVRFYSDMCQLYCTVIIDVEVVGVAKQSRTDIRSVIDEEKTTGLKSRVCKEGFGMSTCTDIVGQQGRNGKAFLENVCDGNALVEDTIGIQADTCFRIDDTQGGNTDAKELLLIDDGGGENDGSLRYGTYSDRESPYSDPLRLIRNDFW